MKLYLRLLGKCARRGIMVLTVLPLGASFLAAQVPPRSEARQEQRARLDRAAAKSRMRSIWPCTSPVRTGEKRSLLEVTTKDGVFAYLDCDGKLWLTPGYKAEDVVLQLVLYIDELGKRREKGRAELVRKIQKIRDGLLVDVRKIGQREE